jgi:hypothetical protein
MEVLAAFSFAGTILEFSRFGISLLSDSLELYKSSKGVLSANEQIELATADLRALLVKFRTRQRPQAVVDAAAEDEENEDSFQQILREAEKAAVELLGRLERLKVKGPKSQKWKSVRKAIQSVWTKGEIGSLTKKLERFKEAVETHVLFSIVYVSLVLFHTLQTDTELARIGRNWMKSHFKILRVSIVSMNGPNL